MAPAPTAPKQVTKIPGGYQRIGPVPHAVAGDRAAALAELQTREQALAVLQLYFDQHALQAPTDLDPDTLVYRVVAFAADTPQVGWGTLTVEFGYRPRPAKRKSAKR